jgi:tetratricopeptide (TPR) repeat protein
LIIARGDEFCFWDVESCRLIRRIPRDVALFPGRVGFSADARLMAVEMAPAIIHLKEAETGRTVARLEDPHGDRATWQGFTPDGTRLVVISAYASAVHIWDLRAIRARLKAMNLDWDWPELSDVTTESSDALSIESLPRDGLDPIVARELRARQAIERAGLEYATNPDSASSCNGLAWAYLAAPESLRDARMALPLAEKAVRLAPGNACVRNTLGVALYRAGRCAEAVEVLRANLKARDDWGLAFDLYFLAMCHARLGDDGRARDYFDWASSWTRAQRDRSAIEPQDLAEFRAEAEELLNIDRKTE